MMGFLKGRRRESMTLHQVGQRSALLDTKDITVHESGRLGAGRFGTVVKGEWLGVPVAIKRILPGVEADPHTKKLLETQIAQLLPFANSHPNILPIYGICELPEGGIWLVLKHGKKGSLTDVLRNGAWRGRDAGCPRKLAVHVALGICSALAYLHSQSPAIVYRDLKPGNIIISGGMTPLLDPEFGAVRTVLSEIVALRTRTNSSQGSGTRVSDAAYHAPECLTASKADDWQPPSDVYSLGQLLYDMCTGTPPFANMSEADVAKALLATQRPPLPANLHPRLASIIQSCWQDDPAARPTARVLLHVFAELEKEFADDDDAGLSEYVGGRGAGAGRSPAMVAMMSPPHESPHGMPASARHLNHRGSGPTVDMASSARDLGAGNVTPAADGPNGSATARSRVGISPAAFAPPANEDTTKSDW